MDKYHLACDTITFTKSLHIVMLPVLPFASLPSPSDARLVIEIDGSQHYTEQGKCYDEERSQILRAYGLKVLRFSNRDVDRSFDSVCAQIHNIIQERCALPADDDD